MPPRGRLVATLDPTSDESWQSSCKGCRGQEEEFPRNKRATSRPANAKTRKLAPLGKLRADESTRVLLSLIRRHPELRREANELALALIETVDAKKVGTELGQASLSSTSSIRPTTRVRTGAMSRSGMPFGSRHSTSCSSLIWSTSSARSNSVSLYCQRE